VALVLELQGLALRARAVLELLVQVHPGQAERLAPVRRVLLEQVARASSQSSTVGKTTGQVGASRSGFFYPTHIEEQF
jgi:hypothetical protein